MHGQYDISGNKPVTDIAQVQLRPGHDGQGRARLGGEITGIPAAGTTFTKLRIGMSRQQAIDLAGQPTDQGAYTPARHPDSVLLRQ